MNREGTYHAQSKGISIVYEDDAYVVVDKPAGLLSIATDKENQKTAYKMVSDYLKRTSPGARVFVVHRLDRETSGLMLFAKSQQAQHVIQEGWKRYINCRRYIAVVEGEMRTGDGSGMGTIRSYLHESSARIVYSSPRPGSGVPAVTHYRILQTAGGRSLVECQLETGRKNQIRVQFQGIGHPLAGDLKYGGTRSSIGRLALHATELSFTNPFTMVSRRLISPVPDAFYDLGPFRRDTGTLSTPGKASSGCKPADKK